MGYYLSCFLYCKSIQKLKKSQIFICAEYAFEHLMFGNVEFAHTIFGHYFMSWATTFRLLPPPIGIPRKMEILLICSLCLILTYLTSLE